MVPLLARLLRGGYQVDARLLNAAHYGVPQRREVRLGPETTRLSALMLDKSRACASSMQLLA
jgi:hypothetical protein